MLIRATSNNSLLVDESDDSKKAVDVFKKSGIEYVGYDIRKFEESCCGELPTTKAPSVFAVEGVFKGLEKIKVIPKNLEQKTRNNFYYSIRDSCVNIVQ